MLILDGSYLWRKGNTIFSNMQENSTTITVHTNFIAMISHQEIHFPCSRDIH